MKTLRAHLIPALLITWYVSLAGTTVGFMDAALSTRISLEAPTEIIVPETRV